ncbi:MAG: hypothetical protein IJT01_02185 [Selenomonadaceae bacterium]|nr:hypothetical protein [Selenomonadaceae bacterium]
MDAGWFLEKTAESVVPEWGPTSSWGLPTSNSTTIQGLTINWVNANQTTPLASLTAEEQMIVKGLNSEWMSSCLKLIQDSFGMNFEESGTSVKSIDLQFHSSTRGASNPALSSSTLAAVGSSSVGGVTNALTLIVNMDYYDNILANDVNGATTSAGAGYLDRTLAHEFTHAVMAANVNNFSNLPLYIKEGMAELVHGIDDERINTIKRLTQSGSYSTMENLLTDYSVTNSTQYTGNGTDPYGGGYILLRYLAKQGSTMDRMMNDITFQVGTKANQAIKIGFADMRAQSLGLREANGENLSLATRDKATVAIHVLDTAVRKALDQQTTIGAILSRLEYTSANLVTANENTQFSESTIRDADMAKEMTEYTRNNVLMQSAQSMLAQANQNSSNVLSLLQ